MSVPGLKDKKNIFKMSYDDMVLTQMTDPGRDVFEVFVAVFKGTLFLDSKFLFELGRKMLKTEMAVKFFHSPSACSTLKTLKLVFGGVQGLFRDLIDFICNGGFWNKCGFDFWRAFCRAWI